ncbi:spermatogenesis associated protein 5 [Mortierella alpina]|nr:spermatogenesis associated protein 5 [Mortierella alpina]
MDLQLFRAEACLQSLAQGAARQDCCLLHPSTMLNLRVPTLGLVSIQHASLFNGAEAFLRCLPLESVPQGWIHLPQWMLVGQGVATIKTVRAQGIDCDSPLDVIERVTVAPYPFESSESRLDHWISPTEINNAGLARQGKRKRQWIERLLKLAMEGRVLSAGSVFTANVKGQQQRFKVVEIFFKLSSQSKMGVMSEDTLLQLGQESCTKSTQASQLCGMNGLVDEISTLIEDSFTRTDAYTRLNIPNKKAVIVSGVAGSGKKTIVQEIMESDQAAGLSYIHTVFEMALQSVPSAVILQDLDIIAKDRGVDSQLQSSTISLLCKELERARQAQGVFVFAVSRNRSKLPEIFTKQGIFQHEFQVPVPVRAQRQEILEAMLGSCKSTHVKSSILESMASKTAQMSAGYVAKDLRSICRSALLHSMRGKTRSVDASPGPQVALNSDIMSAIDAAPRDNTHSGDSPGSQTSAGLCWSDLVYALNISKPSQQIEFESMVHHRSGVEYGGYSGVKKRVHQALHWPLTNPETFKRMGVRPPTGLLLYGPSGCGKTMLVQSLASESSMNFIPIKGPEIFSKYLGETEATLRRLFAMARQISPCILFFDEMDAIGAKRGWGGDADSQGSNGVNERVLSTLLNEMDGVEERTGVFVIGCTNQPRAMDDALLRPGRLDQLIYIGYPSKQDRKEIIETIGKRIPLPLGPEIKEVLAAKTVGFSPADLDTLFREAAILSLRRNIGSEQVELADIEQVLEKMRPSVQDRIDKSIPPRKGDTDVLIPDLYRQFQQDR